MQFIGILVQQILMTPELMLLLEMLEIVGQFFQQEILCLKNMV